MAGRSSGDQSIFLSSGSPASSTNGENSRENSALPAAQERPSKGEFLLAAVESIPDAVIGEFPDRSLEFEAQARHRAIVNAVADAILVIDEKGVIESANPATTEIFGYAAEELRGRNIGLLMPEPHRGRYDEYLSNYLTTGQARIIGVIQQLTGVRKDGTVFPIELSVSEIRLANRRLFTGVIRDVTQRIQMLEGIQAAERRFRSLADCAPVLIWISGPDKKRTWFNRRWLDFTGRTMEQELGDGWTEGIHQEDLARCVKTYDAAFDAREPFDMDFRLRGHDGVFRWLRDVGQPLAGAGEDFAGYVGSCIDITERKAAEESLRIQVHERTRSLASASERLRQEIQQRNAAEVFIDYESRALERVAQGENLKEQLEFLCASVSELIPGAYATVHPVSPGGEDESVWPAAGESGKEGWVSLDEQASALALDNGSDVGPPSMNGVADSEPDAAAKPGCPKGVRTFEPVMTQSGEILGWLCIESPAAQTPDELWRRVSAAIRNMAAIAIQRSRSQELLQHRLFQLSHVARLATMGELASGLAHELNQPLCAIVNYAETCVDLLKRDPGRQREIREALAHVARQADRAGEVIRRLREFVRRREPRREPVHVRDLIGDVVALTHNETRRCGATIQSELSEGLDLLFVDPIQIQQVLINLIRNAVDAMERGGVKGAERRVTLAAAQRCANEVEIAVMDQGQGVPSEIAERLFAPFFSTKKEGMGLGLSISRSIIEVHGGRIWLDRSVLRGACIRFTIPTTRSEEHGGEKPDRLCGG